MGRRTFINILVAAVSAPLVLWWIFVGRRDIKLNSETLHVNLGKDVPGGINIFDDIIVVKNGDSLRAYEAKCTHLGCMISKVEGNEIVCPCHGSRFNEHGNAVKGPAKNSLKPLAIQKDPGSGDYIISKET